MREPPEAGGPGPPPRPGVLRRHRVLATFALLAVATVVATLFGLRRLAETGLGRAIGVPVRIGGLWLDPFRGRLTATDVVLGSKGDDVTAREVAVTAAPGRLLRGDLVLERVVIDGLRAAIGQAPDGTPVVRGLPLPGGGGDGGPPRIGSLAITDAELEISLAPEFRKQPLRLRIDDLDASETPAAAGAEGLALRGRLRGTLDGAPLTARASAEFAGARRVVDASATFSSAAISRDRVPLPAGFESLTATLDGELHYALDTANGLDRASGDLRLSDVRMGADSEPDLRVRGIAAQGLVVDLGDVHASVGRLSVTGLRGTLDIRSSDGTPTLRGVPLPAPDDGSAPRNRAPIVTLREVSLDDADLVVVPPPTLRETPVSLHFDRLDARLVPTAAATGNPSYQGEARATLDGMPIRALATIVLESGAPRVEASAQLEGFALHPGVLPLPAGLEGLTGTLGGNIEYRLDPAAKRHHVEADLRLDQARLEGGNGTSLLAKRIAVDGARVDLAAERVDLGRVRVTGTTATIAWTESGVSLPGASTTEKPSAAPASGTPAEAGAGGGEPADTGPTPTGASAWKIVAGSLEVAGGTVVVLRDGRSARIGLPSATWLDLADPERGTLDARLELPGGGSLRATGGLSLDTTRFDLSLDVSRASLPDLAALSGALPLALSRGTANATGRFGRDHDGIRIDARIEATQVHTSPPDPARPEEILAADGVTATIAYRSPGDGQGARLEIRSIELTYPYAMIRRSAAGVFPASILVATSDSRAADGPGQAGLEVDVATLTLTSGRVDFVDETVEPAYWTGLREARGGATDATWPRAGVARFDLRGLHDELSEVVLEGRSENGRLSLTARARALSIPSLNPYIAPLLGYRATRGALDLDVSGSLGADSFRADSTLGITRLEVLQTGLDVVASLTGVPFPVAISLMKDYSGGIELEIPVTGDPRSGRVEIGSVVAQAISRAVMAAITSPLRLLGMLFGTDGSPTALAVDPIPFPAGSGDLDAAGEQRLLQIARILNGHPELTLIAKAQLSAEDRAAVGAKGEDELAADRARAVRDTLVGRAPGPAPLAALGRAADAVRGALGGSPAPVPPTIPAARVVIAPWSPTDNPGGDPISGVYVELQGN